MSSRTGNVVLWGRAGACARGVRMGVCGHLAREADDRREADADLRVDDDVGQVALRAAAQRDDHVERDRRRDARRHICARGSATHVRDDVTDTSRPL